VCTVFFDDSQYKLLGIYELSSIETAIRSCDRSRRNAGILSDQLSAVGICDPLLELKRLVKRINGIKVQKKKEEVESTLINKGSA